jgi:hypothetical protein
MDLRLQIYLYQLRLLFIIGALVSDIVLFILEVTPEANDYVIALLLGSFLLNDLVLLRVRSDNVGFVLLCWRTTRFLYTSF